VEAPPTSDEVSERAQAAALEFSEGERSERERTFFRRNSRLREEAIKRLGVRCVVCRLDFGERYGSAGQGYIEVHHLNPFAERMDAIAGIAVLTKLDEVVPVCANCHRVIHRQRPAITISELKAALKYLDT
jgi:5-methylcytosine-specific restriction protein A